MIELEETIKNYESMLSSLKKLHQKIMLDEKNYLYIVKRLDKLDKEVADVKKAILG